MVLEYLKELEEPERLEPEKHPIVKINSDGSLYKRDKDGKIKYFSAEETQDYFLRGKSSKARSYGSIVMKLGEKILNDKIEEENYNKKLKFVCG